MREKLIRAALGEIPADIIFKNANVLNVFTGEIIRGDVAVIDGYVAGVGSYSDGLDVEDVNGGFLVPGFINTHCHVESSMVTPDSYCREELRHGTTTLITDPHEIANVAGLDGVNFMLGATKDIPINYFVQAPSCVPATPFENAGAILDAEKVSWLLNDSRVLGLAELMNYPGVLGCDKEVMEKLALASGMVIDGHAPGLSGGALQAYASVRAATDHESTSFEEALEKLRAGIAVLVREGSACKDLSAIIPQVISCKMNTDRLAFCTDDKHIADIRREGTIRHCIKKAISLGLPVQDAYRMASINAARIYRLWDLGAIAPGYRADILVVTSLEEVDVKAVYSGGKKIIADELQYRLELPKGNSVNFKEPDPGCFDLQIRDTYPVIELLRDQVVTKKCMVSRDEAEKLLKAGELCKIAVLERHHATGNVGVGLLKGYGLKNGAVATTVGHDSHNLIIAGTNDEDMLRAARYMKEIGGGYAFIQNGKRAGDVPLPIYGLMSGKEPDAFIKTLESLKAKVYEAGVSRDIEPFITLSFMALPVIPEVRITDMGMFDVTNFSFI
ncbi:MAG: adenine deaminase [Oscillospiraceae bacterium]|nr:adenine deaminase [Oscillospiraceae bacterium]